MLWQHLFISILIDFAVSRNDKIKIINYMLKSQKYCVTFTMYLHRLTVNYIYLASRSNNTGQIKSQNKHIS